MSGDGIGCQTGCANLVCAQFGCQRLGSQQPRIWPWVSTPLHPMYYPDQTRPVIPVDEEAVRRIVREELGCLQTTTPPQNLAREGEGASGSEVRATTNLPPALLKGEPE